MLKVKILAGLAIMTVILIAVTSTALAAPNIDVTATPATTATPAPLTGIVQTITPKTDANNVTTIDVTLVDQNNVTQTVTLSLADAVSLGLVTVDANNIPTVNTAMVGQSITIQSPTTTPTPTPTPTATAENPVGAVIASFFGLDYSTVDQLHTDGTGYGVIAQACWMSYQLEGDAKACADIVAAKKSGDYSAFVLPDGSTATNWGQFKKALSDHQNAIQTLGAIVSGRAEAIATPTPTPEGTPSAEPSAASPSTITQPGNGNGNPDHPGNGNGNHGNGNGNNGQGNGNGNKPDKPNNGKGPNK